MVAIIISFVSLAIAVISLAFTLHSQRLQNKVNKVDLKLKEEEWERRKKESEPLAIVKARVDDMGKKHKMKVWNAGNVTAYNVNAFFENSAQIIIVDKAKMPYEILEPGKSFELNLIFPMGSPRKFEITTTWEDSAGHESSNTQMEDI